MITAWASNEKAADSHDGLSAANVKEKHSLDCVEFRHDSAMLKQACHCSRCSVT